MPRSNLTEAALVKIAFAPRPATAHMTVPAAPLVIDCTWPSWRHSVVQDGENFWQTTEVLGKIRTKAGYVLNPVLLRTAFEEVRKPGELAAFLAMCGPFRERGPREGQLIKWPEFQAWQDYVRAKRAQKPAVLPTVAGALDVAALEDPKIYPEVKEGLDGRRWRRYFMSASTTLEAICATVAADEFRFARFGVCELKTCQRLFEFTTEHDKHFCSPEHARQEAKRLRTLKAKESAK